MLSNWSKAFCEIKLCFNRVWLVSRLRSAMASRERRSACSAWAASRRVRKSVVSNSARTSPWRTAWPSRTKTLRTWPATVALTMAWLNGDNVPAMALVRTKGCSATVAMSLGVNSSVTAGAFFLASSAERAAEFLDIKNAATHPTTTRATSAVHNRLRRAGLRSEE